MKTFDIPDNELRALLQKEATDEPSMGFNQSVLSKIERYERKKLQPIKAPKWLIISFIGLFLILTLFYLLSGNAALKSLTDPFKMPAFTLDLGLSGTWLMLPVLTGSILWMAIIFDRFLSQQTHGQAKKN